MRKCVFVFALVTLVARAAIVDAERVIYPVRDRIQLESLNGTWDFKFQNEDGWRKCRVPGTWETQGLSKPAYQSGTPDLTGCYHRVVNYNPAWKGRHVIIRFDGVLHEYDLYVNGVAIGGGVASYNMHQFDITDALKEGENSLDLTVRNKGKSSGFNRCDDWDFAGIQRDVDIFTIADEYIEDIVFRSKVDARNDAAVEVRVKLSSYRDFPSGGKVNVSLSDAERRHLADFSSAAKSGELVFSGKVEQPLLWTAETPNLHYLMVELVDAKGDVIQRTEEKVGIREVRVDGKRLLINNKPVKLRGVCLNETDPIVGRAFRHEDFRQRLVMMKRANINYIRTAHYTFAPAFYELAAEMGFYLVNEVPLASCGRGILGDKSTIPYMRDRAIRAVRRDRNCPAVIVWSVGNEHPYYPETVGPILDLVKEMDPTRPRTLPHPKPITEGPEALDKFLTLIKGRIEILSPHYCKPSRLEEIMSQTDMPLLQTEYGHAMGNGFNEFQSSVLQFMQCDQLIGGSVWLWHDQGVLRDESDLAKYDPIARKWPPTNFKPNLGTITPEYMGVWTDARHFIDTHGEHGTDGVVYANGYPKESWQLVRKMYSPVSIVTNGLDGVKVINTFDFKSLAGYRLVWNGGEQFLSAPAHGEEYVALGNYSDAAFLNLRVVDPNGACVYETAFRLNNETEPPCKQVESPQLRKLAESMLLKVGRKDGICSLCRLGKVLEAKNLKNNKNQKNHRLHDWRPYLLKPVVSEIVAKSDVLFDFTCTWYKDNNPQSEEFFKGEFRVKKNRDGAWKVMYKLNAPKKSLSKLQEIGIAFSATDATRVDWDGLGPWTSTPGKSLHSIPGCWKMHKDDIYFDGNRSDVRWAMVSDGSNGFVVSPKNGGEVSFENVNGAVIVSCNVHVSGYGSKFGDGYNLEPIQGKSYSGTFEYRAVKAVGLKPVVADRPFSRHYGW